MAPGASNMVKYMDPRFSDVLNYSPTQMSIQDWAALMEGFKNWPFAPTVGNTLTVYAVTHHPLGYGDSGCTSNYREKAVKYMAYLIVSHLLYLHGTLQSPYKYNYD